MEEGLSFYTDDTFDFVILSRTIQELPEPQNVIKEMLRVGKYGIIAFLNFGYISNRFQYLLNGGKPTSEALPHSWYNSPNIHPLSIKDFENYCQTENISIKEKYYLNVIMH